MLQYIFFWRGRFNTPVRPSCHSCPPITADTAVFSYLLACLLTAGPRLVLAFVGGHELLGATCRPLSPRQVLRPLAPFIAASTVTFYLVNQMQDLAVRCTYH